MSYLYELRKKPKLNSPTDIIKFGSTTRQKVDTNTFYSARRSLNFLSFFSSSFSICRCALYGLRLVQIRQLSLGQHHGTHTRTQPHYPICIQAIFEKFAWKARNFLRFSTALGKRQPQLLCIFILAAGNSYLTTVLDMVGCLLLATVARCPTVLFLPLHITQQRYKYNISGSLSFACIRHRRRQNILSATIYRAD